MNRFVYKKPVRPVPKSIISVCVFLLIFLFFFQGISSVSENTKKRQRESLENAITRGITYCYAVEGAYPENLSYLKENYGLAYDENLFFVDYRISGANILPDVTIIEREVKR